MMGLGWVGAILVGAGWLALGYCFGARYPPARILVSARLAKQKAVKAVATDDNGKKKKKMIKDPLDVEKLADILQDFKMVLVAATFHSINSLNEIPWGRGRGHFSSFCFLSSGFGGQK